jgi:hypothetical protein
MENIGKLVKTFYGRCIIEDFRESDKIFTACLVDWKLATNKSPILYLTESGFTQTSDIRVGDLVGGAALTSKSSSNSINIINIILLVN